MCKVTVPIYMIHYGCIIRYQSARNNHLFIFNSEALFTDFSKTSWSFLGNAMRYVFIFISFKKSSCLFTATLNRMIRKVVVKQNNIKKNFFRSVTDLNVF